MPFFLWSRTAANNGTADTSCPWPEGMAPAQVNDSARGNMARLREFADDIAGAIVTAGTSSAYTVTSYEGFTSLSNAAGSLNGNCIAFTPHTGNASPCTLNVDGLGAKPLRLSPGVEVPVSTLAQGTPYVALYNNADGVFYLRNFLALPYVVPIGMLAPFLSLTPPNSNFVLPYGQALSRTVYATLFALIGTTFGSGDGSTTFNIPDLRGRVPVAQDNMGGVAAGRITSGASGVDGTTIGSAGGIQSKTLAVNEMPQHTHTLSDPGHSHVIPSSAAAPTGGGGSLYAVSGTQYTSVSTTGITIANAGSSAAFSFLQPSIVMPYILRVI